MGVFLQYMIDGFHITPANKLPSMVVWTIFNATLRFATLYGVVYTVVVAFRAASG